MTIAQVTQQIQTNAGAPLLLGFAIQTPGTVAVNTYPIDFTINANTANNYLIDFTVLPLVPARTNCLVEFNVISGVTSFAAVDFNVIEKRTTNHLIDFSVVKIDKYVIDFNVVQRKTTNIDVSFNVVGAAIVRGTVSFNVVAQPMMYYVDFNVLQQPVNQYPIMFSAVNRIQNVPLRIEAVATPGGSVLKSRNCLIFKVYDVAGVLLGGNSALVDTPSGTGIYADISEIPQPSGVSMTINVWNNSSPVYTYSGVYQESIGLQLL